MRLAIALGLASLLSSLGSAQASQRLAPSIAAPSFGAAVATSFDAIAVGAPELDGHGGVFVFEWSNGSWVETQLVEGADAATGDFFGAALAIAGPTLVVGAPNADGPSTATEGAAYVYRRVGATWIEEQKLVSPTAPNVGFGSAVAIDGDRILVAPQRLDNAYFGAVFVFAWDGSAWVHAQTIPDAHGPFDDFGRSIAAQDGVLVVGARGRDVGASPNAGAAWVYRWGGGAYQLEQMLAASDPDQDDLFGHDVAIETDAILVAAASDDEAYTNAGAAYLFRYEAPAWSIERKLLAPGEDHSQIWSVALGADIAVLASRTASGPGFTSGRAWVFRDSGGTWPLESTLSATTSGDFDFGADLAAADSALVVGLGYGPAQGAYAYDFGICGNGRVGGSEACDDGNGAFGDGCNPLCQVEQCSNGIDDDGDGASDFPADPGCKGATSLFEQVECQDGIDNDGAPGIDFDGGASLNGGVPIAAADPQCVGKPWRDREASSGCGLGAEMAVVIGFGAWMRTRRRVARS